MESKLFVALKYENTSEEEVSTASGGIIDA
jgi:hypothetical protein